MTRHLFLLALPVALIAQVSEVELTTPVLGYVHDAENHSLRTIDGVPGSAVAGGRVQLNIPVDKVWLSPNRTCALANSGEGLFLLRLSGGVGAARLLDTAAGEQAGFSPDGQSAIVLSRGKLKIWRGLPDQPVEAVQWPWISGDIQQLALTDDSSVAAAVSAGSLWFLGAASSPAYTDSEISGIQFLRATHTLLAADSTGNRILTWGKFTATATPDVLANEQDGISAPKALALSSDESVLAVLGTGKLILRNQSTGRFAAIAVDNGEAQELSRAQGNAVFQFQNKLAVSIADADSGTPRLQTVAWREN